MFVFLDSYGQKRYIKMENLIINGKDPNYALYFKGLVWVFFYDKERDTIYGW